ncbi:MAG: hypothetical protein QOK28_1540 [Actinomycetota bacterium]|jgi:uncharacterized protein (TIGR03083 family)
MLDISADIRAVHVQTAADLVTVGPEAPSGLDRWNAADLAAHLLSQTGAVRYPLAVARWFLNRGARLGSKSGAAAIDRPVQYYARRGFDTAVRAVRNGPPFPLMTASVAPVALFEIWVHDDDLRRANNLGAGIEPPTLSEAVAFMTRYQRKVLRDVSVDESASPADQLRWLSGRPSSLAPHEPPLSI